MTIIADTAGTVIADTAGTSIQDTSTAAPASSSGSLLLLGVGT